MAELEIKVKYIKQQEASILEQKEVIHKQKFPTQQLEVQKEKARLHIYEEEEEEKRSRRSKASSASSVPPSFAKSKTELFEDYIKTYFDQGIKYHNKSVKKAAQVGRVSNPTPSTRNLKSETSCHQIPIVDPKFNSLQLPEVDADLFTSNTLDFMATFAELVETETQS